MESIVRNCNDKIRWERTGCHVFSFTNVNAELHDMSVTVTGEGYDFSFSPPLAPDESQTFTLPSDGVYTVTVTLLDGNGDVVETLTDTLFELCDLAACQIKLLKALYCSSGKDNLIKDPCFGQCEDSPGQEKLYHALQQLNAMQLAIFSHTFYDAARYHDITDPDRASHITDITALINQVKAFTKACGFDCESGATGTSKPCSNC